MAFSPTGSSFCACTPGGFPFYRKDDATTFAPFDVDEAATPESARQALRDNQPAGPGPALALGHAPTLAEVVAGISLGRRGYGVRGPPNKLPRFHGALSDRRELRVRARHLAPEFIEERARGALRDEAPALGRDAELVIAQAGAVLASGRQRERARVPAVRGTRGPPRRRPVQKLGASSFSSATKPKSNFFCDFSRSVNDRFRTRAASRSCSREMKPGVCVASASKSVEQKWRPATRSAVSLSMRSGRAWALPITRAPPLWKT